MTLVLLFLMLMSLVQRKKKHSEKEQTPLSPPCLVGSFLLSFFCTSNHVAAIYQAQTSLTFFFNDGSLDWSDSPKCANVPSA